MWYVCIFTFLSKRIAYFYFFFSILNLFEIRFLWILLLTRVCFDLVDPTSTTTDNASRNDMKTPNVSILPATASSTFQLMIVFGGILGGLVVVFMIFVLVCFLKQRSPSDHSNDGEFYTGFSVQKALSTRKFCQQKIVK